MASHQVIVISELAPRLKSYDAEAAQKFVSEYFSHRNRVGAGQAIVPMSSQIDPNDLDTLLERFNPKGWCQVVGRPGEKQEVEARSFVNSWKAPMTPASLSRSFDEEGSGLTQLASRSATAVKFDLSSEDVKVDEKQAEPKGSSLQGEKPLKSVASGLTAGLKDLPEVWTADDRGGYPVVAVEYLSNAHVELMLVQMLGPKDVLDSIDILERIKMDKDGEFQNLSKAMLYVRRWKEGVR